VLERLIRVHGASVTVRDSEGRTAFQDALLSNNVECIALTRPSPILPYGKRRSTRESVLRRSVHRTSVRATGATRRGCAIITAGEQASTRHAAMVRRSTDDGAKTAVSQTNDRSPQTRQGQVTFDSQTVEKSTGGGVARGKWPSVKSILTANRRASHDVEQAEGATSTATSALSPPQARRSKTPTVSSPTQGRSAKTTTASTAPQARRTKSAYLPWEAAVGSRLCALVRESDHVNLVKLVRVAKLSVRRFAFECSHALFFFRCVHCFFCCDFVPDWFFTCAVSTSACVSVSR
jgi:hypothetical protein